MERERRQLAAEVHDGLAQHLALALRELALPAATREPRAPAEAVTPPTGSSAPGCWTCSATRRWAACAHAVEAAAERARAARAAVRVRGDAEAARRLVTLVSRVVSEALANADAHARARVGRDRLAEADEPAGADGARTTGEGFDPATRAGRRATGISA